MRFLSVRFLSLWIIIHLTQERALNRHVELATARGPVLVEARTMIFLDRFPVAVVGSFLEGAEPIGTILKAARLEFYREVVATNSIQPVTGCMEHSEAISAVFER